MELRPAKLSRWGWGYEPRTAIGLHQGLQMPGSDRAARPSQQVPSQPSRLALLQQAASSLGPEQSEEHLQPSLRTITAQRDDALTHRHVDFLCGPEPPCAALREGLAIWR